MTQGRRKRVNFIKKMIVYGTLALMLLSIVISICLGLRLHYVEKQLQQEVAKQESLQQQLDQETAKVESFKTGLELAAERENTEREATEVMADAEPLQMEEAESNIQNIAMQDDRKRVYLTFDDGPSYNTAQILDLLAEYDVKATFFVTGDTTQEQRELYCRIVEEGHSIGVHSYSHRYSDIYASKDAFFEDFYMMSDYVYDVTGIRPTICRLPGGSSNTVSNIKMADVVNELEEQGVTCYDWNISGGDAEGHNLSADQIAYNVTHGVDRFQTSMVLLHDGKDKGETIEALRLILDDLTQREDIQFLPITEDTPIILHITH